MGISAGNVVINNELSWDDFLSAPVAFVEKSHIFHLLLLALVALLVYVLVRLFSKNEATTNQKILGLLIFSLLAYVSFNVANIYHYQLVSYLSKQLPNTIFIAKSNRFFLDFDWYLFADVINVIYPALIALYFYIGIKARAKIGGVVSTFWLSLVKVYKRI